MATLKDIALRCCVTPTVVSAVLNHRQGTVCCSESKRKQIEKTAAELHYHVNIMARSIVQQRIPIVALMFHKPSQNEQFISRYFSSTASELNFQLLQHELESLLSFYRSEEEQIDRFLSLMRNGLIGGVISNLIPGANTHFIQALQNSGMPYVLLGEPDIPAAAIKVGTGTMFPFIGELMQHTHTRRCYLHRVFYGEHQLALYQAGTSPEWNIIPSPELTGNPENLLLSYSAEFYWNLKSRMNLAAPAIVEEKGFEYLIPPQVPYLLWTRNVTESRSAKAAALLATWMKHGITPPAQTITMPQQTEYQLFL